MVEFCTVASIPLLSRTAVNEDYEKEFNQLPIYA